MSENISYCITPDQAETICKHFGKNVEDLEHWEISELLDRLIDEFVE